MVENMKEGVARAELMVQMETMMMVSTTGLVLQEGREMARYLHIINVMEQNSGFCISWQN